MMIAFQHTLVLMIMKPTAFTFEHMATSDVDNDFFRILLLEHEWWWCVHPINCTRNADVRWIKSSTRQKRGHFTHAHMQVVKVARSHVWPVRWKYHHQINTAEMYVSGAVMRIHMLLQKLVLWWWWNFCAINNWCIFWKSECCSFMLFFHSGPMLKQHFLQGIGHEGL